VHRNEGHWDGLAPDRVKVWHSSCVFRVLICDDAVAFPDLFSAWMEDCDGAEVVGTARNPEEAVELSAQLQPDVIVLDHLLREETSADLAPRLRDVAPEAKMLLISGMPQVALSAFAAEAGADAHVSKALSAQDICSAVVELGGG
jgi:DNA-binding NarL/FixJ family response regulator